MAVPYQKKVPSLYWGNPNCGGHIQPVKVFICPIKEKTKKMWEKGIQKAQRRGGGEGRIGARERKNKKD